MKLGALTGMECRSISQLILLITLTATPCFSDSPAVSETSSLSAFVGTCVEIKCAVTKSLAAEDALLFWMKDGTWDQTNGKYNGTVVYSNKPERRTVSPEFTGRVTYKGSARLSSGTLPLNNPSCNVSICDLREQDTGKYFFRYIPNNKKDRWKTDPDVSLTVTVNPCEITFNKPAAVQEGHTITLSCSTPTTCSSLLKIESVLPSSLRTSQSSPSSTATADFTALWTHNNREFTCQTQGNEDPQLVKKINITVEYNPRNTKIETVGQTTDVAVQQSVIFRCNTDANPAPHTYEWFQEHKNLQGTTENSLELKNVQRKDEGCYRCRATNRIGSGTDSEKLCIKVLYPPTDLVLSMDTEVTEGQRVSISCRVDSSPAASLNLSRTSQGSTEELNKTTGSNSLSFSVTVSSAHSGQYTCTANNSLGSKSTQRSLRVKYGPKEVKVQADPGLTVKENMTLTLSCSTQSDPPVTLFSWSRGPAGQERHVHTGMVYTVKSVSAKDTGLYSCTAHHPIRNQTSPPAQVQVQFGPKQVVVLRGKEEQGPDGSSSVTLSCSSHSFPPSRYTWFRREEGGDIKESEKMNYTVPSTQSGLYYCTAKNDISQSTSEPVSVFQEQEYVKYIFVAVVLLLIIFCVFIVYRLKRKNSAKQEGSNETWQRRCSRILGLGNNSANVPGNGQAQTHRRQDVPRAQQREDQTNGASSTSVVYSTVNFPKKEQDQPSTSNQVDKDIFYASLHFNQAKRTVPPKSKEEDVVYSAVKINNQASGTVYENFANVQKAQRQSFSDSSDDEVEVNYSQVNFKSKARNRDNNRLSAEEDYSLIHF